MSKDSMVTVERAEAALKVAIDSQAQSFSEEVKASMASAFSALLEAQAVPELAMEMVEVSSVEMLDAACKEAIACEFAYKGKKWKVSGRRLTPSEKDRVDLILERAMPDLLPSATGDAAPRYNLREPGYLAEKQKFKAQARALALFLGYPIFSQNEKVKAVTSPKVNIELLTNVMQEFFTTDILETMWDVTYGYSRLWERVNFF